MGNDNALFLKEVKNYLEPLKENINYYSLQHGFIDFSRFIVYSKMIEPFCHLKNAKILDVGCGSGGMSIALSLLGAHPTGFDMDFQSVKMAKIRLPQGRFAVSGGYVFPFIENTFNGITMIHVIEHVPSPQKIVNEAFRILKPGGILLMECPNRFYPKEPHQQIPLITILPKNFANYFLKIISIFTQSKDLKARCLAVANNLPNFVSYFTLKKLAKKAGFQVVGTNEQYDIGLQPPTDQTINIETKNLIIPLVGDWDGNRKDSIGFFDKASSTFCLDPTTKHEKIFSFGSISNDNFPLVGDWNGDGKDTIGIYQKNTGSFHLKNSNSSGEADISFNFGKIGNILPLVGDWNGDGIDSVGLYDLDSKSFFLKNSNDSGKAEINFSFGSGNGIPLVGDWFGNGFDSIGFYNKKDYSFFLKRTNNSGKADWIFHKFPPTTNSIPLIGDWDGDGKDTIGFYDSTTHSFLLYGTNEALNQKSNFKKSFFRNLFSPNTLVICKKPIIK